MKKKVIASFFFFRAMMKTSSFSYDDFRLCDFHLPFYDASTNVFSDLLQ